MYLSFAVRSEEAMISVELELKCLGNSRLLEKDLVILYVISE
jgi:hypothetical protein